MANTPNNEEHMVRDATEAQLRDQRRSPGAAVVETACGAGNSECVYVNDCPLKERFEDYLFEQLCEDIVIAIEVRWCGKYTPKNIWSGKP